MIWRNTKLALKAAALLLIVGASGIVIVTRLNGGQFLSVQSNSMVPTFSRGALAAVTPVSASQLKIGNIITFLDTNNSHITLTHRIVQTPNIHNNYKFVTKGDANKVNDPPISASAIIGKERFVIPYAGNLTNFIKQPIGLILIIYLPALAIIIEEIRRLSAYYRSRQPYVAFGYSAKRNQSDGHHWLAKATSLTVLATITLGFITLPVQAALQGKASLTGITISTAVAVVPPPPQNTCNNNTTIDINNSSDQTGSSGNVTNSGNTIGGSATSGSVNSSNSTSINISTTGC